MGARERGRSQAGHGAQVQCPEHLWVEAAFPVVVPGCRATAITAGIGHAVEVEGARPSGPAMPHDIGLAARRAAVVRSTRCRLLRHVPWFSELLCVSHL